MNAEQQKLAEETMSDKVDIAKMYVDMEQSKAYAEHREKYTDELFKRISDYCKETNPNLNLAVDVGCGPGVSTTGFAKYFKKVIGVDISETQVACAPKNIPNCEFKVGVSDKLPFLKSGSVDLFSSGTSFDLMPQKETFAEAHRVLRPGGTIAIFGHGLPEAHNPEMKPIIEQLMLALLPYWPKQSIQMFNKFADLELPYPGWIRDDTLRMTTSLTIEKFMGSMKSAWPYVAYCREHPKEDLLGKVAKQVSDVLERTGAKDFTVNYNLFILMGHKPKN